MSKRQFLDLSFRIISVFLFLSLLARTPEFLIYYADVYADDSVLRKTVVILMFFAAPLGIIWFSRNRSEWFIEKILGKDDLEASTDLKDERPEDLPQRSTSGISAGEIQQVGFVLLGLWTVSTALPELVQQIAYYGHNEMGEFNFAYVFEDARYWGRTMGSLIQTIIGVLLMFSGDQFSESLERWRSARADLQG
jgi:hypothetical protein